MGWTISVCLHFKTHGTVKYMVWLFHGRIFFAMISLILSFYAAECSLEVVLLIYSIGNLCFPSKNHKLPPRKCTHERRGSHFELNTRIFRTNKADQLISSTCRGESSDFRTFTFTCLLTYSLARSLARSLAGFNGSEIPVVMIC